MTIRFLLDENMPRRLLVALQRHHPEIDVLKVGDDGAPPYGTLDPDILLYLEATQRILLTDNRKSFPTHLSAHADAGHHHWGIFVVRKDAPISPLIEILHLYWAASEADEWIDSVRVAIGVMTGEEAQCNVSTALRKYVPKLGGRSHVRRRSGFFPRSHPLPKSLSHSGRGTSDTPSPLVDSVGKGGLGDKVGVWHRQTPTWGR